MRQKVLKHRFCHYHGHLFFTPSKILEELGFGLSHIFKGNHTTLLRLINNERIPTKRVNNDDQSKNIAGKRTFKQKTTAETAATQ